MTSLKIHKLIGSVASFGICCVLCCDARAQVSQTVPQLDDVGIVEHLSDTLPLNSRFVDENGRPVSLRDYFQAERPVILSLNYSNCPMLCNLQLVGLVEAMQGMDLIPGRDFDIISVSIDPLETPIRALQTKQSYVKRYGQANTGHGWHFLTGQEPDIRKLADAVGFQYRFIPERNEYAHAAAFIICTKDGRISRYLYGVSFQPATLRLSLVEAADGKIGTAVDQVLLFCFQYDAAAGNYAPTATGLMKIGGLLTVVLLAAFLFPSWLRWNRRISKSKRRKRPVNDLSTA